MKHLYLYITLFIFSHFSVWAQDYNKFDILTIDDGLSQNTANCFLQDNLGFMWVGTQEGLNMYDGVQFRIFQRAVGDTTSLTDDYVLCLFEDSQRNLWVGTEDGLNRFDRAKQNFKTYKVSKKPNSLRNATITAISEDKNGFIWVATEGGLYRFDPKTEAFKDFSVLPNENTIRRLAMGSSNDLWLGTEKGLFEFDTKTSEIKQQLYPNENIKALQVDIEGNVWIGTNRNLYKKYLTKNIEHIILKDFVINHFAIDERKQVIWVGTETGLLRYHVKNQKIKVIQHNPAHIGGITANSILSVYLDKAGVLWLGTNALGINRFDEKRIKFKQYFYYKQTPEGTKLYLFVRSIWQDRFGYLWVGTNKGLYKVNRKTGKMLDFAPLDDNTVAPIFEDSKGNVWIGTFSKGLFKYKNDTDTIDFDPKKLKNYVAGENSIGANHIRVVFEDSKGKIWIGTDRGGVAVYRPETDDFEQIRYDSRNPNSLPNDRIRGIFEDKDKDIWISTYGGGLALLEAKNGKIQFKTYKNNYADSTTISTDRVYPMHQTEDGTLWVLTSGGGLNRFDKKTGTFKTYTQKHGLPNNVLYGVLPDSKGYLWFSTNRGLSKFDPKNETFKNYSVEDGLQSNEFNAGAAFKNSQGEMFFGGIKGLNYFFPDSVTDNTYLPPIAFTDFKIAKQSVPIGEEDDAILKEHISLAKKIYLPNSKNSFSLEFAALHFSNPKQNRYKYKLEGFDADWVYSDEGYANYTNLDYGEYVFKVHGTNADGVWNEQGIGLVIVVKPAWYETFWIRGFILIGLIFGSYAFYTWRVRRIEYKKQQLERLVAERTVQLEIQKREIEEQASSLQTANDQIIHTSDEIEKKNKDITASIVYASRIQKAIMPKLSELRAAFPKGYFRFFKPRDIVSGDFYWFAQKDEKLIIAAADCTGHGVPGAFMSMAGDAWLDQIVNGRDIVRPDLILNELHRITKKSLKQDIEISSVDDKTARDGMDIALCCIDTEKHILGFAGAKNPLIYIQNGKSTLIKGDKSTIGGLYTENDYHFTLHRIILGADTTCYIFTDGFQDQFGGKTGRKFSVKRLEELLFSIHDQPVQSQYEIIGQVFDDWKAGSRQIDDILIVGFKW